MQIVKLPNAKSIFTNQNFYNGNFDSYNLINNIIKENAMLGEFNATFSVTDMNPAATSMIDFSTDYNDVYNTLKSLGYKVQFCGDWVFLGWKDNVIYKERIPKHEKLLNVVEANTLTKNSLSIDHLRNVIWDSINKAVYKSNNFINIIHEGNQEQISILTSELKELGYDVKLFNIVEKEDCSKFLIKIIWNKPYNY